MNWKPSKEVIESTKEAFPAGSRVELISMDDPQAPAPGTYGTVQFADDMGQIGVHWDTGSGLGAIPGIDEIRSLVPEFTGTVRRQIMDIRSSGLCNMFDVPMVQRLAFGRNYYDLVNFLSDHQAEYTHFILTGQIS